MQDWLTPGNHMTPQYALALALIAGYWLWRVAREARQSWGPRASWWTVPGLMLLWLTPLADVPALFGLGAALLLLAEFWPGAFRPARERPGWAWPLVGVLVGLALLGRIAARGGTDVSVMLALAALLAGLGGLLAAALYRERPTSRTLGLEVRFARVQLPEWPDLSVTLTERGARLVNVSDGPLRLAGWSPSGMNAWLRVRTEGGTPLNTLQVGQSAFLPLNDRMGGVRVWYVPGHRQAQPRLFRADWTPQAYADQRVLN
ncbi:hypothetical protein E5F05_10565 [Deinococcus metallilatus]|uniref:Uncharacterized protein n=1 Tax=Deinococcus metallilatus TaxID=1211322 RepID=A0AAJ5JYI3_9DEIO|nr:hypothetical protein [Deinococcus metallilatus]MBB5297437.1 hypothetical protein [Deinococcus metallilatus]QBY08340.1 hypothetical protein E5F05_10565 [Deinococcus metallilatus]RXJ11443.1 hypothetical protein ERJ73_09385 [Deinococcus metallilatus]TLK20610.1 hypothetical protein FCS05_19940 [Deinococcus metallilatus]GMA16994.1 hypothetical protein GCM10025871_33250 [Deinococcus metallilatus]